MSKREITEKRVFAYIEEHHMIAPRDRIVAGVSGGADSVCLLFLLLEYAKRVPLTLGVVHVNHGLRPEAGEDAEYVEKLCRQWGLPYFLTSADVKQVAEDERCSLEDAGRRVRYRAFFQAAGKMGAEKIAVAHNSNDNAETMLFHLFRGSGLKGLCGIAPVRREQTVSFWEKSTAAAGSGAVVIRPILCLERREVEGYLEERQIAWRLDGTNEEDHYSRNRVRHHILPYAEQEVAAGAVGHMFRTAEVLQETESYLARETAEALRQCVSSHEKPFDPGTALLAGEGCSEAGAVRIHVKSFQTFHGALQKRMLLVLMQQLSPTGKDISMVHVRDVLTLFQTAANRKITLPFGMTALRQYGIVVLERCSGEAEPRGGFSGSRPLWYTQPVEVPGEIFEHPFVYDLGSLGKIEFIGIFLKKEAEVPRNRYTKWFDYDKIEQTITIRSRRSGDFLTIADGAGNIRHKLLKDYMITEKIPRQSRDEIPVVAAGSHILWLAGWRVSEAFKVSKDTKRVLQAKIM